MESMITDDEAVAISVMRGSFFSGELPTVDTESSDELQLASLRGQRSLAVRELLDVAGEPSPSLAPVHAAVGARRFVNVFIGNDEMFRVGWEVALSYFASDGEWIEDAVNEIGIHTFKSISSEDLESGLQALAEGALHAIEDRESWTDDAWLTVSSHDGDTASVLSIRPGTARSAQLGTDSELSPWAELAGKSVGERISQMIVNERSPESD